MDSRKWYAWINLMPPPPDDFHVIGEVFVSNPGVQAMLTVRDPQGINPSILILDLHLSQQPGTWLQVMTWKQARYDEVSPPGAAKYAQVEIFSSDEHVASISVDTVQ